MGKLAQKALLERGHGVKKARKHGNAYVEALSTVPAGDVVTFGELALLALGKSNMGSMIQAGKAVKQIPLQSRDRPWWRAVSAGKKSVNVALQLERAAEQRKRLVAEGVDVCQRLERRPSCLPAFLAPISETQIIPSRGRHTHTLIYLHGRSFSGSFYARHRHFFEIPRAVGLRVVLPSAPLQRLPLEWYSGRPPSAEALAAPRALLQRTISEEVRRLRGRGDRLFLGGTSQGCMVGVDGFLRCPELLGGFCGLVGYWPACSDVVLQEPLDARSKLPLRFFNGLEDEVVSWDFARASLKKLKLAGFENLQTTTAHAGHSLGEKEGEWIRIFLEEVLGEL